MQLEWTFWTVLEDIWSCQRPYPDKTACSAMSICLFIDNSVSYFCGDLENPMNDAVAEKDKKMCSSAYTVLCKIDFFFPSLAIYHLKNHDK